jgi:hypothetical protein
MQAFIRSKVNRYSCREQGKMQRALQRLDTHSFAVTVINNLGKGQPKFSRKYVSPAFISILETCCRGTSDHTSAARDFVKFVWSATINMLISRKLFQVSIVLAGAWTLMKLWPNS